ncbi:MAG: glutamate:GABA antiporter, partial [Acidobacteriota bacterium]|nr:glutamate:GABA antiporter [Acidobacteriota bacterium]
MAKPELGADAAALKSERDEVKARSAVFKKELGLRDLVLTQIMYVVGTAWVGTAAKLGHAHIIFWLLAILLFYLPQGAVVVYLNRLMPLEGGIYQWAKMGFNNFVGFMVAWNLWVYAIIVMSAMGLVVTAGLGYATGAAWLTQSKLIVSLVSTLMMIAMVLATMRGLSLGKWVHNAGGVMIMGAFALLIALPFWHVARGTLPEYHPFTVALPTFTLLNLNIFGKMAVGAFSGLEYAAIVAGECRDPARTISRSIWIATPITALMFILGTSAVLAFVRIEDINLISPIPQVLTIGFRSTGLAAIIAPAAILMIVGRTVANVSFSFTGNTRLPMVAGWDELLPGWFTRLHKRYKTPVNSIIFVGIITLSFALAGLIGVGAQESFQLLDNAAGIFYGFAYVALFAIPLFGMRTAGKRPPLWLKVASAAGLFVTLLYCVLSVFPIIDVESWLSFSLKIVTVIVVANLIGAAIYFAAERRKTKVT